MKIAEIFHKLSEKDADRLRELEADIKSGKRPSIHNAGWTSRGYSWSDLDELGFAKKHMERGTSPSEMISWWEYTGPEPVTLHTKGASPEVIEPGYTTTKLSKDYS